MTAETENSCAKHNDDSGYYNPAVDEIMENLPNFQGRAIRHKCGYCAYERGIEDERRRIAAKLRVLADELSP